MCCRKCWVEPYERCHWYADGRSQGLVERGDLTKPPAIAEQPLGQGLTVGCARCIVGYAGKRADHGEPPLRRVEPSEFPGKGRTQVPKLHHGTGRQS